MLRSLIISTSIIAAALAADAAPGRVANIFTDHMVLQRDQRLPVWGWAAAGAQVRVAIAGQSVEAVAGADGKWTAWLQPLPAGGPHTLVVSGAASRTIGDILVGDVWICSGQSNMEFSVSGSINAKDEIAAAELPLLRQFKVEKKTALTPQADCAGAWSVASAATVGGWTAVGFYFARELQPKVGVPIGLINTSWGGTRVEAWTSRDALAKVAGGDQELASADEFAKRMAEQAGSIAAIQKAWDDGKAKLIAWEKDEAHQKQYADPAFDDSSWKEIRTPGDWDAQGFNAVKGEAWYRKTVEIPAAWAGKELELSPGAADEIESSYFAGTKVGATGSVEPFNASAWNQQRAYKVPAALVKAGKTQIAVRVVNLIGQGGLRSNGDPAFMYLRPVGAAAAEGISLAGTWRFDFAVKMLEPASANPNAADVLFNGMVNPLIPFPVKGAIWYQGESNAGNAFAYRERFPAMITDWRTRWGIGDFPFLWVQLANFQNPQDKPMADNWAVVRESQERTLALPNTGTGLAIDIGDAKDIHPKDKQTVGRRLALAARTVAYGEKLVSSGPRYQAMTVDGSRIRIVFQHLGGGLVAKGGELKRFAIAGADQTFVWAQAKIEGDAVVVWSDAVKEPKAVRYAFEINPEGANLYNAEGLPASPFRTDDWPVPTQPK